MTATATTRTRFIPAPGTARIVFTRSLRGFMSAAWRVASWLVCALVSVNLVLLVALQVGPTALGLTSQSISGTATSGATAIAVLATVILGVVVVTGFACWGLVLVLRALWRWREGFLAKILHRQDDPEISTAARPRTGKTTPTSNETKEGR